MQKIQAGPNPVGHLAEVGPECEISSRSKAEL